MTLQEAKEQIAKDNKFSSWEELCKDNPYDPVFYENQALNLVLSSKDKEIAELKEKLHYEKEVPEQYYAMEWKDRCREVEKLKSELSQLKEQNLQLSEQLDQDGDVIQSLQEENIKLAGELKYFTDKFPHNELGWKTKEEEINQLKCTHEVFNMSACVACGFKRTNDNEID